MSNYMADDAPTFTIDEDTKKLVRRRVIHYITEDTAQRTGTTIHNLTQLAHAGTFEPTEEQWWKIARCIETRMMGTDIDTIRQALAQRARKATAFAGYARDFGVNVDHLQMFLDGKSIPSADLLQKFATDLFYGACYYDPASGTLRSTNKTPARAVATFRPEGHRGSGEKFTPGAPPPLFPAPTTKVATQEVRMELIKIRLMTEVNQQG